MAENDYDIIIVGGGFFGCSLALELKKRNPNAKIVILEKEADLLLRASYTNQARVHQGYHYPRNIVTALRSRINYQKFLNDYKDCIYDDFDHYYAIARQNSNINAGQFVEFCKRIEAPLEKAPKEVSSLFESRLIEQVFKVTECAFDSNKLREKLKTLLEEAKIKVELNSNAIRAEIINSQNIRLTFSNKNNEESLTTKEIYNCTYSQTNSLLKNSGLPQIPIKQELIEMALVKVPTAFEKLGITVMCGPFFSLMPFPALKQHTLSHVRYTPHHEWREPGDFDTQSYFKKEHTKVNSNYMHMLNDAVRYIPSLNEMKYLESLWEIKTLLPRNENDDGRPILIQHPGNNKNITCILGGKIDNIYDLDALWKN